MDEVGGKGEHPLKNDDIKVIWARTSSKSHSDHNMQILVVLPKACKPLKI